MHRKPRCARHEIISKELLESIRELSPIDDIIGNYVQLKRSGSRQLLGRCCFHPDKTPSLSVSINKQAFHCHGCGAGGDVFAFLRILYGCSFRLAVQALAERAGVRIEDFVPSPEQRAKVVAAEARRAEEGAFKLFCDERIRAVNERCRSLGRAATHAENCLRAGETDLHIQDAAWSALQRFIEFEARIQREGLLDVEVLRTEWQSQRGNHVAART